MNTALRIPLHIKLMAAYGAIVLGVLLPSFFYLRARLVAGATHAVQLDLTREAALVRDRIAAASPDALPAILDALAFALPERMTVFDTEGRVTYERLPQAERVDDPTEGAEVRAALSHGSSVASRRNPPTDEEIVDATVRYPAVGPTRGAVRLARRIPHASVVGMEAQRYVNDTGAVALAAAVFLGLLTAIAASRPIQRLTAALRAYEDGDFGHPIDVNSNDELGDMARSARSLAARLRERLVAVGADRATLRALLDELPVGVVVYGPDESVAAVNGAARRLCDLRPDLANTRAMEIQRIDDHAAVIARVLATGETETVPLVLPWLQNASLTARWVAVFTPEGERLPALVILDGAPGMHERSIARCARVLRETAKSLPAGATRRRALDAADDAEALTVSVAHDTTVSEPVTVDSFLADVIETVGPDAAAMGVRLDFVALDRTVSVATAGGRASPVVRRMVSAAMASANPSTYVTLRADANGHAVRFSVRPPATGADTELAMHLRPLGGELGQTTDGDRSETYVILPRG